jgi:hypothetical protein
MRRLAAISVLAVIVAACASPSPSPPPAPSVSPSPVSPSAPQALTVPTVRWLSACRGIGLADATLTGDPADPRIAWLDLAGHGRRDVVFPPAFTARFVPSLEVLDEAGRVVARAGDRIADGCLTGSGVSDPLLILRP